MFSSRSRHGHGHGHVFHVCRALFFHNFLQVLLLWILFIMAFGTTFLLVMNDVSLLHNLGIIEETNKVRDFYGLLPFVVEGFLLQF